MYISAFFYMTIHELTRWQLILPYVDVDLKYYDLGMESRDAVCFVLFFWRTYPFPMPL